MQEEIINDDLLVKGNVICGEDGILEAEGHITAGFSLVHDSATDRLFKDIPDGDLELAGRKIIVHGNVYVWGDIYWNPETYKGHVSAGMPITNKQQ